MLFYKHSKLLFLIIFILFFTSCTNKSISPEELSTNSYFINTPCHKINNSSNCDIKSKVILINNKKELNSKINQDEYFKLKKGENIINIESEFIDTPYIFETIVSLNISNNQHYSLKYDIKTLKNNQIAIKYQIISNGIVIKEISPKYMKRKDSLSIGAKIKEYSIIGLKGVLLVIDMALDIAYLVK